jgi:hypothetical protein
MAFSPYAPKHFNLDWGLPIHQPGIGERAQLQVFEAIHRRLLD